MGSINRIIFDNAGKNKFEVIKSLMISRGFNECIYYHMPDNRVVLKYHTPVDPNSMEERLIWEDNVRIQVSKNGFTYFKWNKLCIQK